MKFRAWVKVWRDTFSTDDVLLGEADSHGPTEALNHLLPDGLIEVSVVDEDGNETVYAAELRPLKRKTVKA